MIDAESPQITVDQDDQDDQVEQNPLADMCKKSAKRNQKSLPSYDLSKLSFLVVEKHPAMRAIIREVLHQFEVAYIAEASSPEQGFEFFCQEQPDITFIDWAPGFNGIELLHKIRRDELSPNPTAPVVIVTGNTETRQVVEARDAGMTEFLATPVSADTIYKHIVSIIDGDRKFVRADKYTGPDRRRHQDKYGGEKRRKEDENSATNSDQEAE